MSLAPPPPPPFFSRAKRASKAMNLAETRRVSIVFAMGGGLRSTPMSAICINALLLADSIWAKFQG